MKLTSLLLVVPVLLTALPLEQVAGQDSELFTESFDSVELQALDKITARISRIETGVDEVAKFGTLEITLRACRETPPLEKPESAAFLEIVDRRPDSAPEMVFSGWMFASSPALSALEHPIYDVWVLDCRNRESSSSDKAESN